MRRGFFGLLVALGAARPAVGQARAPRFQDYPVQEPAYRGPHAAPRIQRASPAWAYRTRIREAAQQPPNFAGHYVLAAWGCGAECLSYALIDVKTGAVSLGEATVCCWFAGEATCCGVTGEVEPVDFRLSSRLVVLTGQLNEAGPKARHYFQLTRGRLVPVR
jgi:hypothetical protein